MAELTPLDLTDDELDELAEITLQDIMETQQFITRHLDTLYKNLLLAESQELVDLEENADSS